MSAAFAIGLMWGAVLGFWVFVMMEERLDRLDNERFEHELADRSAKIAQLYGKVRGSA